ncbi:MAG: superfamily phosphatase [Verrucomicrobiota bacterium]|jgi:HAD superfamily hydrolase (TIGR01548 family)
MAVNGTEQSLLVFDMDGVLVNVADSYRAAIVATVQYFTGKAISATMIQQYKNAGGWNNDWALAQKLILDTASLEIPYDEIVAVFQDHFLGKNNDGLILRERWIPADGLLEKLAVTHRLAIFTGRPRAEVDLTLARFIPSIRWSKIIADGDIANAKPAPDGLIAIAAAHSGSRLTYFGDTIDDAQSARAASVRFIGVADARSEGLRELLDAEGAETVIENINEIEEVL